MGLFLCFRAAFMRCMARFIGSIFMIDMNYGIMMDCGSLSYAATQSWLVISHPVMLT